MKTSSAKAKGRRLAQLLKEKLLNRDKEGNPEYSEADIVVTPSGVTGPDLQLHGNAAISYPYVFECKNQEKVNLWASWEQAKSHEKFTAGYVCTPIPILVIGKNRTKPIVVMDLDDFIRIC